MTNIIKQTSELLREANKQIQEANSAPDHYAYEDKINDIEEQFREKIARILYPLI